MIRMKIINSDYTNNKTFRIMIFLHTDQNKTCTKTSSKPGKISTCLCQNNHLIRLNTVLKWTYYKRIVHPNMKLTSS